MSIYIYRIADLLVDGYPSLLQTRPASLSVNPVLHTVPQRPSEHTSTRPSLWAIPPTSLIDPAVHSVLHSSREMRFPLPVKQFTHALSTISSLCVCLLQFTVSTVMDPPPLTIQLFSCCAVAVQMLLSTLLVFTILDNCSVPVAGSACA